MTADQLVTDNSYCSGCTACLFACPHGAISMGKDGEGFLYPRIDADKCIDCGLCRKVCDSLGEGGIESPRVYAAYAIDQAVRRASSSGGIFSLLAENILLRGGVVYGAAFDEHFEVKHIAIENVKQLDLLRGSKYVQSALNDTFAETKENLGGGREILFSGTPCQIGGLKGYLKSDYPNLITVDLVCHGVPSPRVWKKYVDIMKKGADAHIERISFRTKNSSWKRYAVSFSYENDTAYLRYHWDDPYMRGFLKGLYLRPSCYNCRFKSNNRASDITLADFWGIENVLPEMDDDKGTSLVIANTRKGRRVLSEIKDKMRVEEVRMEVLQKYNTAIQCSAKAHPQRAEFFNAINIGDKNLLVLVHKYTRDSIYQQCKSLLKRILNKIRLLATTH